MVRRCVLLVEKLKGLNNLGLSIHGGSPKNSCFITENPMEMHELGAPPVFGNLHLFQGYNFPARCKR